MWILLKMKKKKNNIIVMKLNLKLIILNNILLLVYYLMNMETPYKILIDNREYTEWSLYDSLSLNEVDKIDINPSSDKLFSCDVFEVVEFTGKPSI